MLIDGVFASEAIDSSGEILDVKGCDISDLEAGLGVLNWEHRGDDAAAASANDIIGKIVFAKKIYGPEDCTDERQLEYWQKVQLPLIYGIARLFDGSGHPGAIAAAAMIRDYQKNGEPLLIRYSIEGTTLEKDKSSNRLTSSIARRIAATIKPCNKSCHSGLLSDPNDPTMAKKEAHYHPNFTPLGGSMEIESTPVIENQDIIRKAMTAGSYNAAPGTLTGGSALQVEDRGLRNRVKAAVRDWDKKTPFKKFLKHRLPEASDEFIDRFSDLVGDYTIKKAQREVLKSALVKKATEKIKAKQAAMDLGDAGGDNLTIGGKPVKPNPQVQHAAFDEKKGVLHTPRGSFPLYIPSRDKNDPASGQKFANIMNDPKVNKFHDYAMENWAKLHQHAKAGTLPPEVVMHGVLFSQLSPNTPVPMQELMYSHLVDAMHNTGVDPRDPKGLPALRSDWLERDKPQRWPEHSREHFRRLEGQLRMKMDSKGTGRKAGDIGGFMLANNKFKNMSKYHQLHDSVVDLVGRHRHDARSGVEELMHHKMQAQLWEARRKRELGKGRADIGEYAAGPSVPGLAPKTARYTYGMLGGGNVMVPDTHFSRYLFGLDRDKDAKTIAYLRNQVLWNENNSHVLGGIDRYYAQNHDAVQHMLQHPKWGKLFEKPEDAIFPAFWKNWVGILPHEASRGMKTNGWNESTDHRPFWEAINPYLNKSEDKVDPPGDDDSLPMRTARTHAGWVEKYGEMPAMMMYFHFLVPQLLKEAEKRHAEQAVVKFEAAAIEMHALAKEELSRATSMSAPTGYSADPAPKAAQPQEEPGVMTFNGKKVRPGLALVHQGSDRVRMKIVDQSPSHFTAVPEDGGEHYSPNDMIRLPRENKGQTYNIYEYPEHVGEPSVTNADTHSVGDFNHHPETRELAHGFDVLGPREAQGFHSLNAKTNYWGKHPSGGRVFVKQDPRPDLHLVEKVTNEGLYHNLAKDYFGLGEHVSPTAVVYHPHSGREMAIIKHIEGEHYEERPEQNRVLAENEQNGSSHKLALMNLINGNADRHHFNYLIGSDRKIHLIDHGLAFNYNAGKHMPAYVRNSHAPIHPEAEAWLHSLKPEGLEMQMRRHGVDNNVVRQAVGRLKSAQIYAKSHPGSTFNNIYYSGGAW